MERTEGKVPQRVELEGEIVNRSIVLQVAAELVQQHGGTVELPPDALDVKALGEGEKGDDGKAKPD
ncbi:MAG: hypothetical protein DRO87_13255 [Candidatus Thorarchaeota archaeon]|nr:MAG: hypothetical protein DRO87_13255 [Candidatus Thorarchaeota archaeon]